MITGARPKTTPNKVPFVSQGKDWNDDEFSSIDSLVNYQFVQFGDYPFSYKFNPVNFDSYRVTHYLV